MKNKLKKITNLTVNELLSNEVILPSNYLEKFNYHAKELEINLDDENFKQEINRVILEDFKTIENYMNLIMSSTSTLKRNTIDAKNAIVNKDENSLDNIYEKMIKLEKELNELNNKLFLDDLTLAYNKKWIYNKFLDEKGLFQEDGICVLVDVVDYSYIFKEYGELLANNLLIFAVNFIDQKLKDEHLNFKIIRYNENKFMIFLSNTTDKKNIINSIINLEQLLLHTTLKSNSGLFIKAKYEFGSSEYKSNQESKEVFEKLLAQEK